MAEELLETVEVNPKTGDPLASVIWLHGLGADASDFEPIVNELRLPEESRVRFVFPNAPKRPITINGGMVMPGWYDISSLELTFQEDHEGLEQSVKQLRDLVVRERKQGVPCERIILAGFSQGGAIALHLGLRYRERLGGILALSTYLPSSDLLQEKANPKNRSIPILMVHGLFDPVVPLNTAQQGKRKLEEWGYQVDWKTYPMPHSVCEDEINVIGNWLQSVLK